MCGQNNVEDLSKPSEGKVLTYVHRQMSIFRDAQREMKHDCHQRLYLDVCFTNRSIFKKYFNMNANGFDMCVRERTLES